jgi:hypothetical protein
MFVRHWQPLAATDATHLEPQMPNGGATSGDGRQGRAPAAATPRRPRRGAAPEPVAVTWSERQRRPVAFVWRRRRYPVERVLETWVVETGWWKEDGFVSRSYWRVRAGGRVADLRYDRVSKAWALERVLG